MASIIQRPLSRFRKTESYKPLHERWGDVTISAPTEGAWNQLENPRPYSHKSYEHSHRSTRDSRESYDGASSPEVSLSRKQNSSFSMRTLNPRRLSMRLAPRSKQATYDQTEMEPLHHAERRTEFAYKPINQDYPTQVAETAASRVHDSPRFRYIPADMRAATASPGSERYSTGSQHSVQSNYDDRDGRTRRHHIRRDSRYEDTHDYYLEPLDRSRQSSRTGYRSSGEFSEWAIASHINTSTSLEKKRLRAAKRMTMTMVPDAEDIYG